MRRHDLRQPYQGCQCKAHKAIRRKLRKLKACGTTVPFMVSALGSRRRLQALCAIGYSPHYVANETGISVMAAALIAAGRRKTVTVQHARDIAEIYDRLSMTPAPRSRESTRARNRARSAGWYPPLSWDDIDSPRERAKGRRAA